MKSKSKETAGMMILKVIAEMLGVDLKNENEQITP